MASLRKYMVPIITGIVALVFLVVAAIVALVITGHQDSALIGTLIGLVSPTIAALVALVSNRNTQQKVDNAHEKIERIDKVVNHHNETKEK